jgi:hypothetical protein
MLKIIAYICCDGKQRELGEQPMRFIWSDARPKPKELISMGDKPDWMIAAIADYESPEPEQIPSVYVVYVYRGELPARSEWEFYACKESHPNQSLEIQISEIGANFIGWEASMDGELPEVEQYIVSYGVSPSGDKLVRVEPWFKTEVVALESYIPERAFKRVHVSKHIIKTVSKVAAEMVS